MSKIILYGVPGSGKTSLARALSTQLQLPYFEADEIRKLGQKGKLAEKDPFYFLSTTEAYQAIGKRTAGNVIKGLLEVRNAYRELIDGELESYGDNYVAESAFLDPGHLKNGSTVILLVALSEARHRVQFLEHRTEDASTNGQFENARLIQDFLVDEAKRLDIPSLENQGYMESLVAQAKKLIV